MSLSNVVASIDAVQSMQPASLHVVMFLAEASQYFLADFAEEVCLMYKHNIPPRVDPLKQLRYFIST